MQSKFNEVINYFKIGDLKKSKKICEEIISNNPENPEILNLYAFILYSRNDLDDAVTFWKKAIKLKPNYFESYNGLGNAYSKLNEYDKSIKCFQKAFEIEPKFYEAYNNLGNLLIKKKDYKKSIEYFNKALNLKSNFINSLKGKGYALLKTFNYKEAIPLFLDVIKKNPKDAETLNYLGMCYNHLKTYEKSIFYYEKCLEINPNYKDGLKNLLNLLTYYEPENKNLNNIIIEKNRILKKNNKKTIFGEKLIDQDIYKFFRMINNTLKDEKIFDNLGSDQIFRRNEVNLNCERHFEVFNKYDVIPKFCFSCYKIQINPKNILELLKLYIIFDIFNFEKNNFRKTLIEIRNGIAGTYKGLIYCNSLTEAEEVLKSILPLLKKNLGNDISTNIKRGCTEFAISHKNFDKIDGSVKYKPEWEEKEDLIDKHRKDDSEAILEKSLAGLNIQDALIIRNWLIYAKKIEDNYFNNFNIKIKDSEYMNKLLDNQIEFRKKEFKKNRLN